MELVKYSREAQSALFAIPALISFRSHRLQTFSEFASIYPKKEHAQRDDGLGAAVPLLAELGIPLPTDSTEAKHALLEVIERQKYILSVSNPASVVVFSR